MWKNKIIYRVKKLFPFLLASTLFLSIGAAYAQQSNSLTQEKINNYEVEIVVNEDASLDVTETIEVIALGNQIRRGIYRDFPTKYKTEKGYNKNTTFEVLEVTRDGSTEPYHIENISNGKRLYIGKEDIFLDPGVYTYTIKYNTNYQLGFFENHDELYYNAIGQGWDFEIDKARVDVILPAGIETNQIQIEGFTGPQGSTQKDFSVATTQENGKSLITFNTTAPLSPREGFTIVIGFPKGFVQEPTGIDKIIIFAKQNPGVLLGIATLIFVFTYYLILWNKVGKDPKTRGVIRQYDVPKNVSSGAARFIDQMGFDNKALTAEIIGLAIKGYLKIKEEKKKFIVEKTDKDPKNLLEEQKSLLNNLFSSGNTFKFINTNSSKVKKVINDYKKTIQGNYLNTHVKHNYKYLVLPTILTIVFFVSLFSFSWAQERVLFLTIWLGIWTIGTLALIKGSFLRGINDLRHQRNIFTSGCSVLFSIPFILGEIIGAIAFLVISPLYGFIIMSLVFLHIIFYEAMKARTLEGKQIHDHLEGLKIFLTAVEDRRYQSRLHENIPVTLNIYEKYLPYAIALNVEPLWTERFKKELDKMDVSDKEYRPSWYTGNRAFAADDFAGGLTSSMSSNISSSSTPPGSSSGFSGGSSGGGGGGGGGGGW